MEIRKENVDDLNAVLDIVIEPTDYATKVEEALKKVSKNVAVPGFRAGKVPAGMVKKMYGKSVLVEELNKMLSDTLSNYISENKLDLLGNPMPKQQDIDFENQTKFTFSYELGLAPQFEVEVSDKISIDYQSVKVDDEIINKYLADVRKNFGKPVNPDVAGEKDVVFVDINQLEADGLITAGGIYKSTSIGIDRLKSESVKSKLVGSKKDDKIVVHCKEIYETAIDLSVMLGIEKEVAETLDCNLQLTVKNIARLEDADLNQELFDKVYGPGKVNSEEEFKAKVTEELATMFGRDSDRKFFAEVEKTLIAKYSPKLPDDFLKRWLISANEKPITREQVDAEYDSYALMLKWKLIENRIIKKYEVSVSPEEALEETRNYVRLQFAKYGQTPDEKEFEKIVASILDKNEEAQKIYENLYSQKLMQLFKTNFKLNSKEVSHKEFIGA